MIDLVRFLFGGIGALGLWVRKAAECIKWGLMDHRSRNLEGSGAECGLNCADLAQEVSEEKNICM